MTNLVIPGVRVEASFDPVPPPPSPTGILGLVGVVDRPPSGVVGMTSPSEIADVLGAGTLHSMPEIADALRNGAAEVVVSAVDASAAGTGRLTLRDRDEEDVVVLLARAQGPWADSLSVRVDEVLGADGRSVRSVDLSVYDGETLVESHRNLIIDPFNPARDLFQVVNRDSDRLVALDATLLASEPTGLSDGGQFVDRPPTPASMVLTTGAAPALTITAKNAGERGNLISVEVSNGRPAAIIDDGTDPTLRVTSRDLVATTTELQVTAGSVADTVTITVVRGIEQEQHQDLDSVGAIVSALAGSDLVIVEPIGGGRLPADGTTELAPTRTVVVRPSGADDIVTADRISTEEVATGLAANLFVDVELDPAVPTGLLDLATDVSPDTNRGFLSGGVGPSPTVDLTSPAGTVAQLQPAEGFDGAGWTINLATLSTGGFRLSLIDGNGIRLERHESLTMNPDSDRYLPAVLAAESERLVAIDRVVPSQTAVLPSSTGGRVPLSPSDPPTTAAYLEAIDALAADSRIDLLAASVQVHGHDSLNVAQVHGALVAFAVTAADGGAPAIAFGSVAPDADDVGEILDHANDVRSQRFVLCAPHGTHAAVAGLVGRLAVHRSPTFKGVPSLRVEPGRFRESELRKLVDATTGNVLVVTSHQSRGVIVVKGVATNGWQLNVTRTADAAVREIKKIAEGFIGELNDEPSRTALGQQITQYLLQLERQGAIVPSADGVDPAFQSRVYASPLDFAQGIVRIDLAIRPVRAIDYVNATIRVKAL